MTNNPFAPKMTETQREEAMRRYGRGESLNRIAKDYRIGSAALTKALKRRGLVLREKKHRQVHVSPELGRKILEDYAAGKAVRRTAAERGVSTGIARRTIKESGKYRPAQVRLREGRTVSIGTVIKRFGSVESACKMAGVPFERRIEQHDGRVGRRGSPARAGVKSPERETTRWIAVRPLKEIEG